MTTASSRSGTRESADEVRAALAEFGFLDDMDATPLRVREWGPEDVLAAPAVGVSSATASGVLERRC